MIEKQKPHIVKAYSLNSLCVMYKKYTVQCLFPRSGFNYVLIIAQMVERKARDLEVQGSNPGPVFNLPLEFKF